MNVLYICTLIWLHWALLRLPNNINLVPSRVIQILITVPGPQGMGFIFHLQDMYSPRNELFVVILCVCVREREEMNL